MATAIGIANITQSTSGVSPVSPYTFAATCSGNNRVLIVMLGTNNNTDVITGVTYNGVAMTKIRTDVSAFTSQVTSIWYLIAPATGSNNVAISYSSAPSELIAAAICLENALQSSQPDTSGTASGNVVNNPTLSLSVGDNVALFTVMVNTAATTLPAGAFTIFNVTGTFIKCLGALRLVKTRGTASDTYTTTTAQYVASMASIKGLGGNAFSINSLRPSLFTPGLGR